MRDKIILPSKITGTCVGRWSHGRWSHQVKLSPVLLAVRSFLAFALISTGVGAALKAAEPVVDDEKSAWSISLQEGIKELDAKQLPQLDSARQKLVLAINGLEQYLRPESNAEGAKWLEFLHWPKLKEALQKEDVSAADFQAIELRFRQNYPGLELAPFTQVRSALGEMSHALRFGKNADQTMELLKRRLEELDQHLAKHPVEEELERSRDVGLLQSYLHDSRQAPNLRARIANQHAQANMQVIVRQNLANKVIGRAVHEVTPVNEEILGTKISGCSLMTGQVECRLIPNDRHPQFELVLDGDFSSNNVGYNRGVKLNTRGMAQVQARRMITVTQSGLLGGERLMAGPVCVDTDFCTVIDSISHRSQLIRNLAVKSAAKTKPKADRIGEQRLQNRIADQFSKQIDQQLAETNGQLTGNSFPILTRLDLSRPSNQGYTTADKMVFSLNHARPYQLSAPSTCPIPEPDGDLVVRVHQSVLMNYGDTILGGRQIKSEELPALAKQFLGRVPEELARPEDERPWSITLANYHPVELELRNGLITITVRITRMDRGDEQSLDQSLVVRAAYAPTTVEGRTELVRQGDVKIDLVGRQARGTRAVTLQAFLQGKFDKLFREKLLDKAAAQKDSPLLDSVKERFPNMPDLKLSDLKMDRGWLQAVWR